MDPEPITPTPPKKSFLFPLLALLLFLSTAFLGYQNMQLKKQIAMLQITPSPTPAPTPVIATNPQTGWQIYTNTRYGYSLEYPPDWTVALGAETGSQIRLNPTAFAKNETLMWVHTGQSYYKDIIDLQNNLGTCRPNSECITVYSKNKTTLDGAGAVRFTRSQLGPGQVLQVDALKNGYVYSLILERPEDSQENIKIFDQILSTFKFLDTYTCPASGWVDCMPGPDAKPECSETAMTWYKANCPNFQGGAL